MMSIERSWISRGLGLRDFSTCTYATVPSVRFKTFSIKITEERSKNNNLNKQLRSKLIWGSISRRTKFKKKYKLRWMA